MGEQGEILSIQAAAARLGVSRWRVWQLIADGALAVQSRRWQGRLLPGVILPTLAPGQPLDEVPDSPKALRRQIERLSRSVEMLAALVTELSYEQMNARPPTVPAPPEEAVPSFAPIAPDTHSGPDVPRGDEAGPSEPAAVAAVPRSNPMTTPAEALTLASIPSRDEVLAPVRELFRRPASRSWWQRR